MTCERDELSRNLKCLQQALDQSRALVTRLNNTSEGVKITKLNKELTTLRAKLDTETTRVRDEEKAARDDIEKELEKARETLAHNSGVIAELRAEKQAFRKVEKDHKLEIKKLEKESKKVEGVAARLREELAASEAVAAELRDELAASEDAPAQAEGFVLAMRQSCLLLFSPLYN